MCNVTPKCIILQIFLFFYVTVYAESEDEKQIKLNIKGALKIHQKIHDLIANQKTDLSLKKTTFTYLPETRRIPKKIILNKFYKTFAAILRSLNDNDLLTMMQSADDEIGDGNETEKILLQRALASDPTIMDLTTPTAIRNLDLDTPEYYTFISDINHYYKRRFKAQKELKSLYRNITNVFMKVMEKEFDKNTTFPTQLSRKSMPTNHHTLDDGTKKTLVQIVRNAAAIFKNHPNLNGKTRQQIHFTLKTLRNDLNDSTTFEEENDAYAEKSIRSPRARHQPIFRYSLGDLINFANFMLESEIWKRTHNHKHDKNHESSQGSLPPQLLQFDDTNDRATTEQALLRRMKKRMEYQPQRPSSNQELLEKFLINVDPLLSTTKSVNANVSTATSSNSTTHKSERRGTKWLKWITDKKKNRQKQRALRDFFIDTSAHIDVISEPKRRLRGHRSIDGRRIRSVNNSDLEAISSKHKKKTGVRNRKKKNKHKSPKRFKLVSERNPERTKKHRIHKKQKRKRSKSTTDSTMRLWEMLNGNTETTSEKTTVTEITSKETLSTKKVKHQKHKIATDESMTSVELTTRKTRLRKKHKKKSKKRGKVTIDTTTRKIPVNLPRKKVPRKLSYYSWNKTRHYRVREFKDIKDRRQSYENYNTNNMNEKIYFDFDNQRHRVSSSNSEGMSIETTLTTDDKPSTTTVKTTKKIVQTTNVTKEIQTVNTTVKEMYNQSNIQTIKRKKKRKMPRNRIKKTVQRQRKPKNPFKGMSIEYDLKDVAKPLIINLTDNITDNPQKNNRTKTIIITNITSTPNTTNITGFNNLRIHNHNDDSHEGISIEMSEVTPNLPTLKPKRKNNRSLRKHGTSKVTSFASIDKYYPTESVQEEPKTKADSFHVTETNFRSFPKMFQKKTDNEARRQVAEDQQSNENTATETTDDDYLINNDTRKALNTTEADTQVGNNTQINSTIIDSEELDALVGNLDKVQAAEEIAEVATFYITSSTTPPTLLVNLVKDLLNNGQQVAAIITSDENYEATASNKQQDITNSTLAGVTTTQKMYTRATTEVQLNEMSEKWSEKMFSNTENSSR